MPTIPFHTKVQICMYVHSYYDFACKQVYIHTGIYTGRHLYMHTSIYTDVHACRDLYMYELIYKCIVWHDQVCDHEFKVKNELGMVYVNM